MFKWLRKLIISRPLTKEEIYRERLRTCKANGLNPEQVPNFWKGIEELRAAHASAVSPGHAETSTFHGK